MNTPADMARFKVTRSFAGPRCRGVAGDVVEMTVKEAEAYGDLLDRVTLRERVADCPDAPDAPAVASTAKPKRTRKGKK